MSFLFNDIPYDAAVTTENGLQPLTLDNTPSIGKKHATKTVDRYGLSKVAKKHHKHQNTFFQSKGYTHATAKSGNKKSTVQQTLQSMHFFGSNKQMILYMLIDGSPVAYGVVVCFNSAVEYYDVTSDGRLVNRQQLPAEYADRFPQKKMLELAGLERWEKDLVYARRVA